MFIERWGWPHFSIILLTAYRFLSSRWRGGTGRLIFNMYFQKPLHLSFFEAGSATFPIQMRLLRGEYHFSRVQYSIKLSTDITNVPIPKSIFSCSIASVLSFENLANFAGGC